MDIVSEIWGGALNTNSRTSLGSHLEGLRGQLEGLEANDGLKGQPTGGDGKMKKQTEIFPAGACRENPGPPTGIKSGPTSFLMLPRECMH